jgi:DNA ligase (NAD+)
MNATINIIKHLVDDLNKYRDAYYNDNKSLISDREYDAMYDRLEALEKETGVILSNSPTQTVGFESVSKLNKVKHNHPLLSLGKTTNVNEFENYFSDRCCVLMGKLDGLTCSIVYRDGKFVSAESRGNGEIGEDITHNARMFVNLPMEIPYKGEMIVDGECIITYSDFEEINKREKTEYKNPRNLVSGTVRQLNNEVVKNRNVHFIVWKLYSMTDSGKSDLPKTNSDCFQLLSDYGFDVVPYTDFRKTNYNDGEAERKINSIKNECEKRQIPIDGIVGMFNDIEYGLSLGNTSHHPRHSLAFKFYQEDNETTLEDIEWSTSRTGLINPVAVFEPIEIDGTTVTRATLNNVSIIKELQLGIGDTITVIKANQIIPKVTQNLTRSNTYQLPTVCPCCGKPVEIRNDNGREMMYCTNKYCSAILHDKISNFASREGMNIVGISDERLKTLMQYGYVTTFGSLYNLAEFRSEIINIPGWGESSFDNLMDAVEQSRHCKLSNVIVAIGIPSIGKTAAKMLERHILEMARYNNNKNYFGMFIGNAMNDHDWTDVPGIGKPTSDAINKYVHDNYQEIEDLAKELYVEVEEVKEKNNSLKGITFCITGKLIHFTNRNALVEDIESNGGIVVSGVTAKTQYLITNDKSSGSSKNKAAEKYGTRIISEEEYKNRNF